MNCELAVRIQVTCFNGGLNTDSGPKMRRSDQDHTARANPANHKPTVEDRVKIYRIKVYKNFTHLFRLSGIVVGGVRPPLVGLMVTGSSRGC